MVVRLAGELYNCPQVLKGCFNAYVLSSLDYCAPVCILSAASHLGLPDSIFRSAERLCGGELCCLGRRRKVCCLMFALH